ncbi:hypothetical protein AURDEDRAFT_168645 [Auricularia subglabra TFB-10046 SS5]|nr:hypothetical protein AURDEDRAFT_168645 [Auricularia subglabra TFB-10046 SS5]
MSDLKAPKCNDPNAILPPDAQLTRPEERKFNRMATTMEQFHTYFRIDFDNIYEMADGSFNERGMSLPMYLTQANNFKRHLEGHHNIEETYIFPHLAQRMQAFQPNDKHRTSHKGIHDGLDKLSELVRKWRTEPASYSPTEMRACLDSFRDVLFRHLDEEVVDLGADNMRKYWTLNEMDQFMM